MENIIDTFTNGFKNTTKNLILFVPTLLLILLAIVSVFIIAIPAVIILIMAFSSSDPVVYAPILIAVSFIFLILLLLVSSFFSAGQIGMSKDVVGAGKTSMNSFFSHGKKYTIRVFLSTLILMLLNIVIIAFWIPLYNAFVKSGILLDQVFEAYIELAMGNFDPFMEFINIFLVPILIGSLLTFIYSWILTFLFYFVSYAIVIDDMPVIAAFKKSVALLKQYPGKVIVFILIISILGFLISVISNVFSTLSSFSILLSLLSLIVSLFVTIVSVILLVVSFVWEARFYMAATEKELYVEEKYTDF
jgi:hypothetical protein